MRTKGCGREQGLKLFKKRKRERNKRVVYWILEVDQCHKQGKKMKKRTRKANFITLWSWG